MKIGLTQRVMEVPGHGERRDCLDQRWSLLLEDMGAQAVPLPNLHRQATAYLEHAGLDAVILTGGNDLAFVPDATDPAPERDAFELCLLDHCVSRALPVLGVCRGMQMLQHATGGKLTKTKGHAGTVHDLAWAEHPPLADPPARVNSYHNCAVPRSGLGSGLVELAWCNDETVEVFTHQTHPWLGVMWHPERDAHPDPAVVGWLTRHLRKRNE